MVALPAQEPVGEVRDGCASHRFYGSGFSGAFQIYGIDRQAASAGRTLARQTVTQLGFRSSDRHHGDKQAFLIMRALLPPTWLSCLLLALLSAHPTSAHRRRYIALGL